MIVRFLLCADAYGTAVAKALPDRWPGGTRASGCRDSSRFGATGSRRGWGRSAAESPALAHSRSSRPAFVPDHAAFIVSATSRSAAGLESMGEERSAGGSRVRSTATYATLGNGDQIASSPTQLAILARRSRSTPAPTSCHRRNGRRPKRRMRCSRRWDGIDLIRRKIAVNRTPCSRLSGAEE